MIFFFIFVADRIFYFFAVLCLFFITIDEINRVTYTCVGEKNINRLGKTSSCTFQYLFGNLAYPVYTHARTHTHTTTTTAVLGNNVELNIYYVYNVTMLRDEIFGQRSS